MTVSIRPGKYIAVVTQRPNGATRQSRWARESGFERPFWWLAHDDERVVYLVRCVLPPPNKQGERQ